MKPTFNIRLWFGLAGLGLIGLMCAVSAHWVASFLTRSLLERESQVTQEFFQSIAGTGGAAIFRADAEGGNRALIEFAEHVRNTNGAMRANLYAPDRTVVWSTEPQLVGRTFGQNAELELALGGERVTEINSLQPGKAEHIAFGSPGLFIEAYLPIRAPGAAGRFDGPVVGVVEFYKFPTALNATIAEARRMVWLLAGFAALVLYLALFWIVQRGARQIEQQQQQLGRLQSLAAIGQLASAIAHSLRNPMAAIRSSAELWRGEAAPAQAAVASEVVREIDRMEGYVRDLLAYAHPQADNVRPLDPMTVVERALAKRGPVLESHGIAIRREDRRVGASQALIDPLLLEHAVTSIVDNAIEVMPNGGVLTVTASGRPRNGEVSLEILDTGPGIPPNLAHRVAESYFTTKARGLGLGLALARGVIERWNGRLTISSQPGSGTCVAISLKTVPNLV